MRSLTSSLKSIAGSMSVAATRAYFVDKMGAEYDLSTERYVNGKEVNATPTIRVLEYTLDANGNRTGEPIVRETITFEGGKVAKSDQVYIVGTDGSKDYPDIWDDKTNVITGKFVRYNANKYVDETDTGAVELTLDNSGRTFTLEAETFFWVIGTIGETEMVLEYQVYLTDTMEGNRKSGVYDTNESAVLNYVNYLGNDCHKDTVTPAFPWPEAVVGYAFYLVDIDGNPLNANGDICSFADSVKLSDPEYIDMLLNGDEKNLVANQLLNGTLDESYDLFDPGTGYKIHIDSTPGENYWTITVSNGVKETTYVTNYGGAPTTENSVGEADVAYDRTVVWFAVVATPTLKPDTVVIDYGLPVSINVTENDTGLSSGSQVTGILKAETKPANGAKTPATGITNSITSDYGTMEQKDGANLKYTPGNMEMDKEDTYIYEIQDAKTGRYYYSTATVIPATTIYYEDGFVEFTTWNVANDAQVTPDQWAPVGSAANREQSQSRPGTNPDFTTEGLDVDALYGYDAEYKDMATYSMGSAMKFTANEEVYGEAQFTFWGTGFDVISLTSNTTGSITVDVYEADKFKAEGYNADSKTFMVDTYYGYKYVLCDVTYEYEVSPNTGDGEWVKFVNGEVDGTEEKKAVLPENPKDGDRVSGVEYAWIVDSEAEGALYQVPVMQVNNLAYGQYTVVITVFYRPGLDHQNEDNENQFDFYLDAVRIYDPANDGTNNQVIEDAYVADGEGWPEYFELRDWIISKNDFNSLEKEGNNEGTGVIFIDNTEDNTGTIRYDVENYTNYGPNNELYLAPGQGVIFKLELTDPTIAKVQIGLKSADGKPVVVGFADRRDSQEINTSTDMYYDITSLKDGYITITNTGENGYEGILSITNIKVTYTAKHEDSIEDGSIFAFNAQEVADILESLSTSGDEAPDETVPETTVPETTEPESSEPEVPDVFEPSLFSVQVSATSVKVASSVSVSVTTGSDVAYITVNGKVVTKYTSDRRSDKRVWKTSVEATKAGEMDITVVCCNSEGITSQPVVKTVTVTKQQNNWFGLIIGFFDRFWGGR